MILKGLKTKSIQKATKKSILDRTLVPTSEKINSVGVMVSKDDFKVLETEITDLKKMLNCKHLQYISYTQKLKKEDAADVISPKYFGWKGVLKHEHLKSFANTEVDVLIALTKQPDLYFEHLFAKSNAKFKVTNHEKLEVIADLTINIVDDNFKTFKDELTKYLTILNKI
jgi:hypothetical protein